MNEREEFEKDAEPYGYSLSQSTCQCCQYNSEATEERWRGWQARAALTEPAPQEAIAKPLPTSELREDAQMPCGCDECKTKADAYEELHAVLMNAIGPIEPAPNGPAYEGEPEGLWDVNQRRTEPAPQDVGNAAEWSVADRPTPAGAAQLPDEVAEMVERLLKHRQLGFQLALTVDAALMLERLARERTFDLQILNQNSEAMDILDRENEQLRARIAELESANSNLASAAILPEGWVLVPKEPTAEMQNCVDKGSAYQTWKNMLAAAPKKENDK